MRKLTKNIFLSILIVSILFCNLMPINSYAEINNKIEIKFHIRKETTYGMSYMVQETSNRRRISSF